MAAPSWLAAAARAGCSVLVRETVPFSDPANDHEPDYQPNSERAMENARTHARLAE